MRLCQHGRNGPASGAPARLRLQDAQQPTRDALPSPWRCYADVAEKAEVACGIVLVARAAHQLWSIFISPTPSNQHMEFRCPFIDTPLKASMHVRQVVQLVLHRKVRPQKLLVHTVQLLSLSLSQIDNLDLKARNSTARGTLARSEGIMHRQSPVETAGRSGPRRRLGLAWKHGQLGQLHNVRGLHVLPPPHQDALDKPLLERPSGAVLGTKYPCELPNCLLNDLRVTAHQ
mmetsp:Transcript_60492/g.171948  ORF Transcript_60492/g.171948 Transcript_60492/m.171948 type:complete len:231 (+) Transcript_60492:472-1164(+)